MSSKCFFGFLGLSRLYFSLGVCVVVFVASQLLCVRVADAQVTPARTTLPDGVRPVIDKIGRSEVSSDHIPGLVILVEDHGVVDIGTYGVTDTASQTAMTEDRRFEIGSTTKQFTAVCILQLVEAGRVSLDDPLSKFVPSYKAAALVTVRQMLGQISGIPEYLDGPHILSEAGSHASFDALLGRVRSRPLDFPPGTSWEYSNTNYLLLGRIVEIVSGQSYESYVREHIFEPAGLRDSNFIGSGESSPSGRGYEYRNGQIRSAPKLDESWAWAAGGIVSTARDLLTWNAALSSGSLLSLADVRLMRTSGTLNNGEPTGYGFGFFVDSDLSRTRIWHGGNTWGFSSADITYPEDGQTVIVLTNSGDAPATTIASHIFAALHPLLSVESPDTKTTTKTASDESGAVDPIALYTSAVARMRALPAPPFVTYRSDWSSIGSRFDFYQDGDALLLSVGMGRDFKFQHSYEVAYRREDRTVSLQEAPEAPMIGRGARGFDPTWDGAYETMRYGNGQAPPPPTLAHSPLGAATAEPMVIGRVATISAAFYRVTDAGNGLCPDGTEGHTLSLAALSDAKSHPLTQVTLKNSNGLFCDMRFKLGQRSLAGTSGEYDLRFGTAAGYWLVTGGSIDDTARLFGFSAIHVVLRWNNSNISPADALPPTTFSPAKEK